MNEGGGECEAEPTDKKKIMVLGGGPNRIGQGIEFDYCCVHAAFGHARRWFETIMVNCNPETVSTDYDTSDRLYFEPSRWKTCWKSSTKGKASWRDRAVWWSNTFETGPRSQWRAPSSAPR